MMQEELQAQQSLSNTFSRRGFLKGAAALALAHTAFVRGLAQTSSAKRVFAYVGTYTGAVGNGGNGEGIYLFEANLQTGTLSRRKLAAEAANPTWLALDPSGRYLYAANEVSNFNGKNGSVSAYAIDRSTGALKLLNVVSSEGSGPAHLSVAPSGKYVFVANYMGGSIAVLPIQSNGALGAATDVHQDTGSVGPKHAMDGPPGSFAISGHESPHPHMIQAAPGDRFVIYTDLGQDRIYINELDSKTGKLTPAGTPVRSVPSGDGPRHFAFHPNGKWMYSIQEESSTLTFYFFNENSGALAPQQTVSSLPPGFTGSNFTSEVMVSPDGHYLYAANRLHDTISIFKIGEDGRLTYAGQQSTFGDFPRHINIDPSGDFLYSCNQHSDAVTSFRIDHATGLLKPTGQYTPVGSPSCIVFLTV